ncbi:MAG: histidine kinase [Verrucomicrobiota bacterium]
MVSLTPETEPIDAAGPGPVRRLSGRLILQAGIWLALSFAIAAMLVVGGPFAWSDALTFSCSNWLPWAVLTPLVFWVSGRFPLVRGHLPRNVLIHLVACIACTLIVLSISQRFPLRASTPGVPFTPTFDSHRIEILANETVSPPLGGPPPGPPMQFVISGRNIGTLPFTAMSGTMVAPTIVQAGSAVHVRSIDSSKLKGGSVFSLATPTRPRWQMMLVPLALWANVGFAVYFIVAAAAHAMGFYRQAKERERQALALVASRNQAKLDALRLQLQPHFLFNTLNAIATLVHRDPRAADRLIGDLSDLLRVSLQTTQHEVTLASELELLEHYLAIEQARLGDRLRIVRDIDHHALAACVPPLILQPLAENAVRHGFEPRLAPGTLTIEARREGDLLRLTVTDDGVGLHANMPRSSRRGIGLANTRERLRTLHGDEARLDFTAPPEGGVRAEITLPFRTAPQHPSAAADTADAAPATVAT